MRSRAAAALAPLLLLCLCSHATAAFVEPQEIAVVHGVAFAVLDGTAAAAQGLGCQEDFLQAPPLSSLWAIADSTNPVHRMAVAAHGWGTSCLVMADGVALAHDLSSCPPDALLRQAVPSPSPSPSPSNSRTPSPTPSLTPSTTPSACTDNCTSNSKKGNEAGSRLLKSTEQGSAGANGAGGAGVREVGDAGVEELWAPRGCDQRILLYRRGPPPSPFAAGDFADSAACAAAWTSADDADASVTCQNGELVAAVPAGKILTLSQTIAAPADGRLQQGFSMAVQISLESSKKMALELELELAYADDSLVQSAKVDLTSSSYTDEVSLPQVLPEKTVVNVTVSFSLQPPKDTVLTLSNLRFDPIESLLANHGLASEDFLTVEGWQAFGKGYMPDLADRTGNGAALFNSVLLLSARMDEFTAESQGARQEIDAALWGSSSLSRDVYVAGYSKAAYASDLMDDFYGIRLDVDFADGGQYGAAVRFPVGSHSWTFADAVVRLPRAAVALRVTLVFGTHTGAVWFDDVLVRVLSSSESPRPVATAAVFGDPRLVTFSSHDVYAVQRPGEYILFQHEDLTVHTRHSALGESGGSVVTAVGVEAGGAAVQVQFSPASPASDPTVTLGCAPGEGFESGALLPGVGVLARSNAVALNMEYDHSAGEASEEEQVQLWTYVLAFTGGEVAVGVRFLLDDDNEKAVGYLQVILRLDAGAFADVGGLLGSTLTGALHTSGGEGLDVATASQAELNAVAAHWEVTDEAESLLCYSGGAGPSTYATAGELFAPVAALGDFSEQETFNANLTCHREKLGLLHEACMLDVLVSDNLSAIQGYHELEVALGVAQEMLLVVNATEVHDFTPEETEAEGYRFSLIIVITMVVVFAFGGVVTVFRCKKRRPPVRNAALADDEDTIELQELMLSEEEQIDRFET